jgi:hypothetical protein
VGEPGSIEREHESYSRALSSGRRLGVRPSEWLDDWWISWSPRNSNQNAEGEWSEWVELARMIIERNEEMKQEASDA